MKRTSLNSATALPAPSSTAHAGRYLFLGTANTIDTSSGLTNGLLRLAPWYLTAPLTIDRIGGDIATAGDAGSKVRLGVYADNGNAYPGALLLDAGQIAGDSATVQDVSAFTGPFTFPAGLVWVGGVVQSVTTTQPTVRITTTVYPPVPIVATSSLPSAGTTTVGYAQSGVTGALPSTFSTSFVSAGSIPRIHARLA
jgi:hypothetical protein